MRLPAEGKRELLAKLLQEKIQNAPLELAQTVPAPQERFEPFPLTEIQQAYWIGRQPSFDLGNVGAHFYVEIEFYLPGAGLSDFERLEVAWRRLVDRHDMLRAVVLPDGRQKILEHVSPYRIELLDMRGKVAEEKDKQVEALRRRMSSQVFDPEQWPMFELKASRLEEYRLRLHLSFDLLIVDVWSFRLLLKELFQLYFNPDAALAPLEISFRDYVLTLAKLKESKAYRRSLDYWTRRLPDLYPAPALPLAKDPASIASPRFMRRSAKLEQKTWECLKSRASEAGLTPSVLLLAVFAEVLAKWSRSPRFTINLTFFNRLPLHPQINDLVGDFTSITLLSLDNSLERSFERRAQLIREQLWRHLDHQHVSGVWVMREMLRADGRAFAPVFPVVFTSTLGQGLQGLETSAAFTALGEIIHGASQTPQVWLDHQVSEQGGALVYTWDAVSELFAPEVLSAMFEAMGELLRRLADAEESWREEVPSLIPPVMPAATSTADTGDESLPAGLLHDLFAKQVAHRAEQTAVISSRRRLTYEELSVLANRVARPLRRAAGARPNSLVAVVMEKGWEQVVAVLGVLRAGAAYLPIDPSLPPRRLREMLEYGGVRLALTQSWLDETLDWCEGVERLRVDELCCDDGDDAKADDDPPAASPGVQDLAYVIFTSGSTGTPKGVMIDHRGAVNTIVDINRRFEICPADRVLALSSLSFDLSVFDIFGTLAAGGTIILPEPGSLQDPAHWHELLVTNGVTVWNSVPALMEILVEYAGGRGLALPDSLRLVLLSGDRIRPSLPPRVARAAQGARVVSLGGATEASIWSIVYPIEADTSGWERIPYGRPLTNQSIYVLNELLEPCPAGVTGQLYLGGLGLARGYWGDEQQTLASFIKHPRTGERLYRAGDFGQYLPDGSIEILGREDTQVKLRGYRIELGEIETALMQHAAVLAAAVSVVGSDGNTCLAAFMVPARGRSLDTDELRGYLKARLPQYMIPSFFSVIDSLPLTPNGKLDRASLPALPRTTPGARPEAAPSVIADVARIAGLIESVIGVEVIEPDTNLLGIGANSLDLIRIVNLLERELNFRPRLDDFYRDPTVRGLASAYERQMNERQNAPSTFRAQPATAASFSGAPYEILLDSQQREQFKATQPGLRRVAAEDPSVSIEFGEAAAALHERFSSRRSRRQFSLKPISLYAFGMFLNCLAHISSGGRPKYLYPSAGGLYPVQTYLHVKPGRVESLPAAIYYYHPARQHLIPLSNNTELDRGIHLPFINQPIFDEAAFSIFLVAQMSAILPMYGEQSLQFATLEAGYMGQLLMTSAPTNHLGLCPIGHLDFEHIRHLFLLDDTHILLHSMLGGRVESDETSAVETEGHREMSDEVRAARMIERIKALDAGEVRSLLEVSRRTGQDEGER